LPSDHVLALRIAWNGTLGQILYRAGARQISLGWAEPQLKENARILRVAAIVAAVLRLSVASRARLPPVDHAHLHEWRTAS
jgi:hypothetical protein